MKRRVVHKKVGNVEFTRAETYATPTELAQYDVQLLKLKNGLEKGFWKIVGDFLFSLLIGALVWGSIVTGYHKLTDPPTPPPKAAIHATL